ncbi:MAG: ABC transporter ATP-binding protein [Phycisphaerae bacterium]
MLELRDITKYFGPQRALSGVSLTVARGQIHGILGENGAGKSTLMNIVYGLLTPDTGSMQLDGRTLHLRSPADALAAGIGMVHQHFKLVGPLTVLENLALSCQHQWGWWRTEALHQRVLPYLQQWQLNPHARVETLTIGQQQRVEIVKALLAGGRILILDEPTAVLTPQEADALFVTLRQIAAQGTTLLFISHKLHEVRQLCQSITILRRGEHIHSGAVADLDDAAITQHMVGYALTPAPRSIISVGPPRLVLSDLSTTTSGTHTTLRKVSLTVHAGEIVGIAGVDGNGQRELADVIIGMQPYTHGTLQLAGTEARTLSPAQRRRQIAFIPEDRQRDGLIMPLSVRDNLSLRAYSHPPLANRWGWLNFSAWETQARQLMQTFDIRAAGSNLCAGSLSGGNQQKTILARELAGDPAVIIACNPTRGLDIAASSFIFAQLSAARARGAAIVLIHSDLDELQAHADRIAVMYNGQLLPTTWPACSPTQLGELMLGTTPAEVSRG